MKALFLAIALTVPRAGFAAVPTDLPDFSHAGYSGPGVPMGTPVVNVRDKGARGDGKHDDFPAFAAAIAVAGPHVVSIPAGRYRLDNVIRIDRPGVVLRGEGTGKTTLWFPRSLTEAVGPGDKYASGGSWSWSGGLISVEGLNQGKRLADVTAAASRGARVLHVSSTAGLRPGQKIRLMMTDAEGKLARRLHADKLDGSPLLKGRSLVDFACRVVSVGADTVTLDRPLRVDVDLSWKPTVVSDVPTVEEVGIEKLTIVFPDLLYAGHHQEPGYNAFMFQTVSNCWIDDVEIVNADCGVILRATTRFCAVRGVRLFSHGTREVKGIIGHHGFLATDYAQDNVVSGFSITGRFIHDLCVSSLAAGNVFMKGRGTDMTFDHHRKAPYENLFTEIDGGLGSDPWLSGGDEEAGPHSGARETFWNVTFSRPQKPPPWAINFNMIDGKTAPFPNLYDGQRARRN